MFSIYRNPNEPPEADISHGARQERNRFKNIEWTAYEAVHKKYLNLGMSPIVKLLICITNKSSGMDNANSSKLQFCSN